MGHSRSQHFMLDSRDTESVTRRPSCRNELLVAISIGTEIMVRAERAGATRTYARSALARHTRGARRRDTAEQEQINATVRMLTPQVVAAGCQSAWIAQQHKHPRSQRAPSDIALTEPDRDMSAVKLVKWCR